MAKRKEFNCGDIVRPHALNGCTLYPVDTDGQIRFNTNEDNDWWKYTIHLRGFEPIVIENGVPYNAGEKNIRFRDSCGYVKVNHGGTIYVARVNSVVKIGKN